MQLEKAAEITPRDPNVQLNLANARLFSGDAPGAMRALERAIQLSPGEVAPLNNLAWLLSTLPDASLRDGRRAVALMRKALELTSPPALQTLRTMAAAHAEAGDFNAAIKTATSGLEEARRQGNAAIANALKSELAAYRQDTPVRFSQTK